MRYLSIAIILVVCMYSTALADSCPYCGQEYGDAMPGDESRVSGLRQQHEDECRRAHQRSEDTSGGGGWSRGASEPAYRGPTAEELEMQRKQQQAFEANERGIKFHNALDFDNAIAAYEEALSYTPHDGGILDNLNKTKASKLNAAGNNYYEHGDLDNAVKCYKEAMTIRSNNVIESNLRKAEGELGREKAEREKIENAERARKEQLATAKIKVDEALDDLSNVFDKKKSAQANSTSSLTFINPNKARVAEQPVQEKGVTFKEVPAPGTIRQQDLPLFAKNRPDIVLDAIKEGDGDWDKSVEFLDDYLLDKGKGTELPNIQEAVSYIEGIRDAGKAAEKAGKGIPGFNKKSDTVIEDSIAEMVAESGTHIQKSKSIWPGFKNPKPESALPNPLSWKEERNRIVADALIKGNGDLEKGIRYLEKKGEGESKSGGSNLRTRQAIQYMEGIFAYKIYSEEQKK